MMVSILIAVKEKNGRLEECLRACLKLSYRDMEIIVLPDAAFACDEARVRVIATGPCLPADKRDIGARHARGALLAFLDDDAYPSPGWLEPAVALFRSDPRLGAVGGPAVTPPDEPPACKASGLVYASWAVSGTYRYRYLPQPARAIDDYPSCNLLVRKDA
ncbi:MAG: glycosyltransferase family 2 protein, partial [Deltaproteobacteria bacterium]